jgi:peptide/nickel transport system substrate-binding protein
MKEEMSEMTNHPNRRLEVPTTQWNRRQFLKTSALGVTLAGVGGTLAACGSSSGSQPSASGSGGSPKHGGTLTLGSSGGGPSDTLDPQDWSNNTDQMRVNQLFDPLVWINNQGETELVLAESITPNANGTEWTITIHPGVVTHQGKPFTADDVLFSLQRIVINKFPESSIIGPVDFNNSKVVNSTTLLLRYSKPFGALVTMLSYPFFYMVPRGFNPKQPDGTGPFMYQSFTPGVQSTFVRNPHYWQHGLPYLDKIVTTDITTETTQVSALQSGQVDVINYLSAASVTALKGGGYTVHTNKSGGWVPFTQDCDAKPFSDVRVRQAFRLIPDRPQMLEQVFGGYGMIGNDVFSPYDPLFPHDLPQRHQDIPQAKALLKAAGYEGLTVTLYSCPADPGEVQMAEVFATQAKAAGVTVNITQQTVTTFYSKYYQKVPFAQDYGPSIPFLPNAGALMIGNAALFNACHFNNPQYNSLYNQAIATTNEATRANLVHEMAHIDYEQGAYIVPVFLPAIEAFNSKVGGIQPSVTGVMPGNADFKNFWMT